MFYLYILYIMAKGSAMGLWRGKKGSSVFYKIKNSNSAQKQGIRERVYEVSNPKTSSQAGQRMKMLPAQRLAAALKGVIERGFEGIKYGADSRNMFMKYALKQTSGIPATSKDDTKVWPGEYLISRGQLPEVSLEFAAAAASFTTSLACRSAQTTVGALSTQLITDNEWLEAGDQITFVLCESEDYGSIADNIPLWRVVSFYLDANDATTLESLGLAVSVSTNLLAVATNSNSFIAAGVIISRESETGGHLRSNCTLRVPQEIADYIFSPVAYAAARRSYQSSDTANSDWPVEPDAISASTFDGVYTLSGLTGAMAEVNGQKAKVLYNEETGELAGVYYVMSMGERAVVGENGQAITYGTDDVLPLTISSVSAFANLPQVLFEAGA